MKVYKSPFVKHGNIFLSGSSVVVPSQEDRLATIAVFVGMMVDMKLILHKDILKTIDSLNRKSKV